MFSKPKVFRRNSESNPNPKSEVGLNIRVRETNAVKVLAEAEREELMHRERAVHSTTNRHILPHISDCHHQVPTQ